MKKLKRLQIKQAHIITAVITVGFLLISVLCFKEAYIRLIESFRDFGLAFAGSICKFLGITYGFNAGSVNTLSSSLVLNINISAESIKNKFSAASNAFISEENFLNYIITIFGGASIALYVLAIGVPIIILCVLLIKGFFSGTNNKIGIESKPLRAFKWFEHNIYLPIKRKVTDYCLYIKLNKPVRIVWLIIAMLTFNIFTIAIEFLALYFNFDFSGIYVQIKKLLIDLSLFTRIPLAVWIVVGIAVLFYVRKKIGFKRLCSREAHNGAFIKMLGSVGIISSVMGAGKTRLLTDILLTVQKQFREMAYEIMQEVDFLFPEFDWRKLENKIRALMESGVLYNISSCEKFAKNWKRSIDRYISDVNYRTFWNKGYSEGKISEEFLLGYNWRDYGYQKNIGFKIETLSNVICDYIKAYFIYSSPTSMIFSNYAISVRGKKMDNGNLPLWVWNFFGEVVDLEEERQNAHVADMDMFRLGKHVKKNNENANAFEYGILGISEADKERGNQFDTNELKKLSEDANQKNDNFNGFIKMSRQVTNIRGRGFFFALLDMQRLGSINLDIRELGDTLEISETSNKKMLMPFFALDELIYQIIVPAFKTKYKDFSFRRGDTTLSLYILKKFACSINNHYEKLYNEYSVIEQAISINDNKTAKYNIMPKKIYADVYSTDIVGSYFRKKSSRSEKGINDIPVFSSYRATTEELEQMNSYMVKGWMDSLSEADNNNKAA